MKRTRAVAIVLFAFLFGGSSAEVAVQAKRAIDRHLATEEEGSVGELVAFELRGPDGGLIARPRLIASPGRPAQLELRDPEHPSVVRVALRVDAARDVSGDLSVQYELELPADGIASRGRVSVTPGVEHALELGDGVVATLLALPVPSAAFDTYLTTEREARYAGLRERT
jgi:hypothetical protein